MNNITTDDTKKREKSTLHTVRLNDVNDVKLPVGGRLFQRFMTRSV